MSTHKLMSRKMGIAVLIAFSGHMQSALAQTPHLGMPVSEADIAAWSLTVFPDGTGLPPGGGTAAQGAPVFAEKCVACHGPNGEGGISAALVGGEPLTSGIDTRKTIRNFWPYATTAYLLALNDIIDEDDVVNAETLPEVRMPNRDGFMDRFPDVMP
jgi:mono/diheme cytochrome c family protein